MNFKYPVIIKTGLLKLAIHVGGNHKMRSSLLLYPTLDETKAVMGNGIAVQIGAVAVEAPAKGRIALKMLRVGTLHKREPQACIGWVSLPEPLITAKIGQPRIYSHPAPSDHKQSHATSAACSCRPSPWALTPLGDKQAS